MPRTMEKPERLQSDITAGIKRKDRGNTELYKLDLKRENLQENIFTPAALQFIKKARKSAQPAIELQDEAEMEACSSKCCELLNCDPNEHGENKKCSNASMWVECQLPVERETEGRRSARLKKNAHHCKNQRIQKREFASVEVRKLMTNGRRGHGLFASEDIAKNSIIGELTGEIITVSEAMRRRKQGNGWCTLAFGEKPEVAMDGLRQGSNLWWSNHSCDEDEVNAMAQTWTIGSVYGKERLILVATKLIKEGTEILWNYKNGSRIGEEKEGLDFDCMCRKCTASLCTTQCAGKTHT